MKHIKRTLALLLAVVLVLALSISAFAVDTNGSIKVDNAVVNKTYTLYRIFDLDSHNTDYSAINYKVSAKWANFFVTGAAGLNYVTIDDMGYVTWKDGANAADFAAAAIAYANAKANGIANDGQQKATGSIVEFTNLPLGYYLVQSDLGALCSLDTTMPNVTIKEKNGKPTVDKEVEENGVYGKTNDANIGDTVNFKTTITVTDGKATIGAGSEISKAAEGTAVTLTANAAPSGKVFDKWEVVSGGITLADANSATTTFTMPASAVSVKATYKNAPHTHTYNQETVKPEALKTPADCTSNAVYFKSCSCGAISTTDTFVAMNTALGHAYGSDWKYDSTNHWHECSRCHDKNDEAAHSASEWIIDTAATETAEGAKHKECTVCKKVLETATIPATGSSHTHSYGTDWKYDDTNHWHECECGDKADIAAHSASEWIIDTAATETAEGAKHKECTVCKKVLETATIPATGSSHTNSYGVYVGMTYTAGNLIYQITSIDTATVGQSKVIGVVAAKKNKITKITIPDRADCKGYRLNVTTIGNNAFAGCKALKKLTIGNKVTVIGKNAFKKCSKLETVVIGKAVKTISSKAFIGDNKIKKITFKGKKLKTVNKNAFSKKAKKNIKSKKTKLKGNKKAIKLFKKKLKIK